MSEVEASRHLPEALASVPAPTASEGLDRLAAVTVVVAVVAVVVTAAGSAAAAAGAAALAAWAAEAVVAARGDGVGAHTTEARRPSGRRPSGPITRVDTA